MRRRKRNRLDRVFQKGRRVSGKWVKLWMLEDTQETTTKVGKGLTVLVRKKAGNAVTRNALKRRIRAIYTHIAGSAQQQSRAVILVKDEACTTSYWELFHDVDDLLHKLAISHRKDSGDSNC